MKEIRTFASSVGIVIGRKNWLFSQTAKGASASADMYSLVETAKANGLDVFNYNEEDNTVASIFANGIRTDYVYDEKGEETFTTAYEDGEAVFSINEKGHLVWRDLKDDNGEGMEFRNLFTGMWACERATMEISCEEEGYKVFINWGSNASEVTEWAYSCTLNFLDNALVAMPFGTRTDIMFDENGKEVSSNTVYEDGKATFALTEEGGLTWKDAKEDAGNGMVFEWVQEITLGL